MLTVLLCSEPVTFPFDPGVMVRKTRQHVPSDHWKCKKNKRRNKEMSNDLKGQDSTSTALRRVEGYAVLLWAIVMRLSPPATLLPPPATA